MFEDLSRATTDHQNAQLTINKLESVNSTLDAGLFNANSKIEDLDRLLQGTIGRERDLLEKTQAQRSQLDESETSLKNLTVDLAKSKNSLKDQKRHLESERATVISFTTVKLELKNTINHQSVQIESYKKDLSTTQAEVKTFTLENKELKCAGESLKGINQSLINENTNLQYEVKVGTIACESEKRTALHVQKSFDNVLLEVNGVKSELDSERAKREIADRDRRDLKEQLRILKGEFEVIGTREKGLQE
jgi:chromosome segregation ATPase